jgi:HEAT repeat protein
MRGSRPVPHRWIGLFVFCLVPLASGGPVLSAAEENKVGEYAELLKNKNPLVRKQAAIALGEMGPAAKAAVPALRDALLDKDEGVQAAAAAALEKIDRGGLLPTAFVKELHRLRQQAGAARAIAEKHTEEGRRQAAAARDAEHKLQAALRALQDELRKKEAELAAAQAKAKDGQKEAERGRLLAEQLQDEIKRSQQEAVEARQTAQKLRQLQTEAETQLKTLQDRNERLVKQIEELTKEVTRLRRGGAEQAAPQDRNPPAAMVEGTIRQVDAATGLVTITIGSDAGVQKGHTLEVYRLKPAPKYLGTLRIVDVKPKEAVGRCVGKPQGALEAGDRVASQASSR